MYEHVQYSRALSHVLYAFANVRMHIDILSGMYTSTGTCDILVHMLRSWGKIQVDQRRSRSMYEHVQYPLALSHVL